MYVVLLLTCLNSQAQNHPIRIFSQADSSVVSFASILFESRKQGFHSDEQGRFTLPVKQAVDTIKIRSIGFQDTLLIWKMANMKGETRVYLKPKASLLAEVRVFSDNKPYTSMKPIKRTGYQLQQGGVGSQSGLLLTDSRLFYRKIQKAHFYIFNYGNKYFPFRIRIYSLKQGKPDQEITQESIVVGAKHRGWNEFDLSQYAYYVPDGGCLVAMEWLNFENYFDDKIKRTYHEKYEGQVLGLADYGKGYLGFEKTDFSAWNFNGDFIPQFQNSKRNMFLNPMIRLTVQ